MRRSLLTLVCFAALAPMALAEDPVPGKQGKEAEPPPAAAVESHGPLSIQLNLDYWPGKYVWRGLVTVDRGLIVQPSAEIGYAVVDRDGLTITPYLGVWNDFTDARLGPGSPRNWPEVDLYGGVRIERNNFELDFVYTLYAYPNRSAGQQQEFGVSLSYDDCDCWKERPLLASINPHVCVFLETQDRGDRDRNDYLEFGVEPTLKPIHLLDRDVTVSVPLLIGTSLDGYYRDADGHNQFLGFTSAGLKVSVPVELVPHASCALVGEITYLRLNAASARDLNDGDPDLLTGRVGIHVEF